MVGSTSVLLHISRQRDLVSLRVPGGNALGHIPTRGPQNRRSPDARGYGSRIGCGKWDPIRAGGRLKWGQHRAGST